MNFLDFLKNNIVIFDGGMGTLLQKKGITPGELPERWNITNPDVIKNIHREYFDAGSNIVTTNTFGANILKFSEEELDLIIKSAITNAKAAMEESSSKKQKFIALDIGPLGKLLKPYGTLDFEDAVNVFSKTIILGTKYGADLIIIETMNDSYETKAALLAAKENSTLPVVVSNAYGEDGKLMTGASPKAMVALLEGMGADCIGLNCSLGPKQLAPVVEEYLKYSSLPVILQPNAGLPKSVDGTTVFDITADEFANEVALSVSKGVRVVGGCCGTTPEYIKAVAKAIKGIIPFEITKKNNSLISSYTNAVEFGDKPVLIGERINPTGKKLLKEALRNNDINYILNEAIKQQEKNVHVLDVNVGLPEIDEATLLKNAVFEIQSICDLPLQIDTASPDAMEKALRIYNGKPLINSVNGKEESMRAIFPLAKKYGGMVVALTLDENGIPKTATERFKIAKKILTVAAEYGIDKKDLIFDTLTMPVSADKNAAKITLEALEMINRELGCLTSLGVSNVSFGLPNRDTVNGTFFAQALTKGLSAAIMNPFSQEMLRVYYSFNALNGFDNNCADYISFAENDVQTMVVAAATPSESKQGSTDLQNAIIKGLKDKAAKVTKELLSSTAPLDIVQNEIIPAL
ncbi:MAG: homocysteine S-methyltransferase family protein, partial [Clostridia bacterium]|nr:homocysteine S-methyltransferase family protein [Clostridia bacterium]